MSQVLPLHLLDAGQIGEVVEVFGNDRLVARLAERGLKKGSRLEVLAPGNPSLFRVDDTKLSLRSDGQVEVMVSVSWT